MDTNTIGTLTELDVLRYVLNMGYSVSLPFGDKQRYDQVWDIQGQLIRVQVKTSRKNPKDEHSILFNCRSTYSRNNRNVSHKYSKREVDYFATMWKNKLYLVPVEECSDKKVLRFQSNQNQPNISWASDYEVEKMLANIMKE